MTDDQRDDERAAFSGRGLMHQGPDQRGHSVEQDAGMARAGPVQAGRVPRRR
ncbi:MAG: hypothetical protein ACR2MP_06200 [Streptosporangiaceae bacterium]